MAFKAFELAGQTVQTPAERCLHSLRIVWRQKRRQRRLHNERLSHPLAAGIVSKLNSEVRRQTKRMLGAHALCSEIETVTRIHCGLTRNARGLFAKNAGALDLVVTFLIGNCPFRAAVHLHLFVLAELRFSPTSGSTSSRKRQSIGC
ncbi:hypothetical protein AC629_41645 [Bradyrhizobium sp. NAS80.1]|nr:hypothetical protein AC629_41645 [Bradyrhizobium sp. NAS80.1]OKO77437.1 hypothetical protein AC630_21070 [Bradyrhizobium sp. AS23.2]